MLILTRKTGEKIRIGESIEILVAQVRGRHVQIGIQAPSGVPIYREEVFQAIRQENLRAAEAPSEDRLAKLDRLGSGEK